MGYNLEFNCLLVVPNHELDLSTIIVGNQYEVIKEKERIYPINIPIEICDENYQYYGKVAVRKLTIEKDRTILTIEVLKIFSAEEAKVYTNNFIRP